MRKAILVTASSAALSLIIATDVWAKSEKDFVTDAVQSDISEVELGKLAAAKGATDEARQLGQLLVQDHGQHQARATALADSLGAPVPTEPSDEAKSEFKRLSKLSGADFDKEFAHFMVDDHKKDIRDYEAQAKDAEGAVGVFARDTIPTLQHHLALAKALKEQP
jgi:putative membrane protein